MIIEKRGIKPSLLSETFVDTHTLIGIGSEGCVHKFCLTIRDMLELGEHSAGQLTYRLITPRVPANYTDIVIQNIQTAVTNLRIQSIIINDYGILFRLMREKLEGIQLILGRTLIRSLEYVPWHKYILRNEDAATQEHLLRPSILHSDKVALFKQYNIGAVELCATPLVGDSIELLREHGILSYVHYDSIIATIGRSCPVVRMHRSKIGTCHNLCDTALNVALNRVWGVSQSLYQSPSPAASNITPAYICLGNVIYYKGMNEDSFPFEKGAGIIFDYRITAAESVNNAVQKWTIRE
ncbi:MAG: hypothetical protein M0Z41_07915 [Peptococcaceae bacterium]|nr:hypothetical protein [Peptococcaceae bacterium]